MKFNFDSYFKDFSPDGKATCCLDIKIEVPDQQIRDHLMKEFMRLLVKEEPEEIEEKPTVIGFQMDHQESDTEEPETKKRTP